VCLDVEWSLEDTLCEDDTANLSLEFHAHQSRHTDGPRSPWERTCDATCKIDEECVCGPAISFVAFCVDGDEPIDPTQITFDWSANAEDEPVYVDWELTDDAPADLELSRVALFYATEFENFDGGRAGTAVVGEGTAGVSTQSPPSPAPDGESALKYEYDEETESFELEEDSA
jgi:hypothetical protein